MEYTGSSSSAPVEKQLAGIEGSLKQFIERQEQKLTDSSRRTAAAEARLLVLEQAVTAPHGDLGYGSEKSIGSQLIESDGFERLRKGARETSRTCHFTGNTKVIDEALPRFLFADKPLTGFGSMVTTAFSRDRFRSAVRTIPRLAVVISH